MPTPLTRRKVVGIGASTWSADGTDERLVTYSLGSCIGLTLYDPVAGRRRPAARA